MIRTRHLLAIAAVPLLLVGCRAAAPANDEPDLSTYPPAPEQSEAPSDCLDISPGAFAALQDGLDKKQPGFTLTDAKAIPAPSDPGGYWLVAGKFDAPGIPGTVGVWGTQFDPTVDADNAYNSIDAIAREFSWYLQPNGADATFPGVDDVKDCL